MFEIDKKQFGAFVARLRKEKGYTQKELAQRLFISDKAVSKWETAVSIPDTTLLIPLAELLGVTVTELLMCERMEVNKAMDTEEVEGIVKTAITYLEESPERAYQHNGKWRIFYGISIGTAAIGLLLNHLFGQITMPVAFSVLMGVVLGVYFCFFAQMKLPAYYDENKIRGIHDGVIRMNIPGLHFNNRNWPYMVKVGRVWACLAMAVFPMLAAAMNIVNRELWFGIEEAAFLVLLMGGLFIPMCIVGRKYE